MTAQDTGDAIVRVQPTGLAQGAVIAQSLDNEWVDAKLTRRMVEKGIPLQDVEGTRNKDARAEYFRGLINTRQLIVNRAFFYNNKAVSRDLVAGGEARSAHRRLLADGSLVPYLLNEREPTDRPPNMTLDEEAFTAWRDTVSGMPASSRITCVRMSWEDRENREATMGALFNPFAGQVQRLTATDIPTLASHVGVPPERVPAFRERMRELVEFSSGRRSRDELVTRRVLYDEFVSVPGLGVSDVRYDRNKPFAAEIKQLLDLIYNVNLADALGVYPLTPAGSIRRVALQEWTTLRRTPADTVTDAEQLLLFLRRQAFSAVQDHLTPLNVDGLELADVWSLRQSEAWAAYIRAFDALTSDPVAFHDRVGEVFDRYIRLNAEIVRVAAGRRTRRLESSKWFPVIEVVVLLGGAVFSAVTGDETWNVVGDIGAVTAKTGGSVQLVLRNRLDGGRQQKFAREIATVRLDSEREWARFHGLVRQLPGYRETRGPRAATSSATVQDELPEY
ncbi:hypothetical protein [Streptomyces sp. UNOC14_S4]|uniref:hypothetical protein n=1 Tax=Streptomyces sp. UNOC14_S4 TaxID=2872340 RepID=UPI001E287D1B|nr:hypothetical protein [Streptomyces sp. UNOC14_S4]MCC3770439.1 hypothetical protein [Streptomyces sp. UNOC14_S4]